MLLAIDIGNTTVSLGVLKGTTVCRVFILETALPLKIFRFKLGETLKTIKEHYPAVGAAVICGVVPKVSRLVETCLQKQWGQKAVVIGRDIRAPLKNNYRNPRQVGQDRLVGAYAAKCLYGQPLIIVDFGTAVTFDVISRHGAYEGGIIVPGLRLSAESLFHKTALLPRIKNMKTPRALIGKDTKGSILSGLFYGYGSMCDGLIDLIAKRIHGKPKVILTGGYTNLMRKFIRMPIAKIDKHLVLKGISLVYDA